MDWQHIRTQASQRARSLTSSWSQSGSGRSDLVAIARALGVDRIELRQLTNSGTLVRRGDRQYTIFLNAKDHMNRQRFSLAHELAHIVVEGILPENKLGPVRHRGWYNPNQNDEGQKLEATCDIIAGELLLPEESLKAWATRHGWTVEWLKDASRQLTASFEATARRFLALTPEPCAMLRWTCSGNQVTQVGFPLFNEHPKLRRGQRRLRTRPSASQLALRAFSSAACVKGIENLPEWAFVGVWAECIGHGSGDYKQVFEFVFPHRQMPKAPAQKN